VHLVERGPRDVLPFGDAAWPPQRDIELAGDHGERRAKLVRRARSVAAERRESFVETGEERVQGEDKITELVVFLGNLEPAPKILWLHRARFADDGVDRREGPPSSGNAGTRLKTPMIRLIGPSQTRRVSSGPS
jgi:hypothetical protein